MVRSSLESYQDTELDSKLLARPFMHQTNWHVITGTSCSGKTTLVNLLANSGYKVVPEVARLYINGELAKGRPLDDIRRDRAELTRQIYNRWVDCLDELHTHEELFLDRGLPDAFAFFRYAGMNPNEILLDCLKYRYASVFILDRLPYLKDGVRAGDDHYAEYFHKWVHRDYRALGYDVIRVPVLSPEDRLALVLKSLNEQELL